MLDDPTAAMDMASEAALIARLKAALVWAWLAQIYDVTRAPGKVVPAGDVQQVQTAEEGVIRAVFAEEGDAVEAGDPLLELDILVRTSQMPREVQRALALPARILRLEAEIAGRAPVFPAAGSPGRLSPLPAVSMPWLLGCRRWAVTSPPESHARRQGFPWMIPRTQPLAGDGGSALPQPHIPSFAHAFARHGFLLFGACSRRQGTPQGPASIRVTRVPSLPPARTAVIRIEPAQATTGQKWRAALSCALRPCGASVFRCRNCSVNYGLDREPEMGVERISPV